MDIGRGDVVLLMDKLADRAPVMANRTLATLRKMTRWLVERGTILASPTEGISAPARERQRERILTDDEGRWFRQATSEDGYAFEMLFRMLLVTAQRRDEVSLAAGQSSIWRSASGRSHERRPRTTERMRFHYRRWRWSFAKAQVGDRAVSGFSKVKERLSTRMEEIAGTPIPP
jgi:hypothetical protein